MNSKIIMTEWVKNELTINLDLNRRLHNNITVFGLSYNSYISSLLSFSDKLENELQEEIVPVVYQPEICNLVEIAYEFIDWFYIVKSRAGLEVEHICDSERDLQGFSNLVTKAFFRQFWNSQPMRESWHKTWEASDIGQEIGKGVACKSWYASLFMQTTNHPRLNTSILVPSLQCVNWEEVVEYL